jgi:periplasmic copper chaperone A
MPNHKRLALATLLSLTATIAMAGGTVTVEDPYARAVPPGQPTSAAFMGLVNGTGAPRALVGGTSDAAEVVELHTHTMEDGMMKMRRVERIDLPAGETVTLAPGELHVMLIGLKRGLNPGDQIELTLDLDDGTVLKVQAPVREVQAMQHDHHH